MEGLAENKTHMNEQMDTYNTCTHNTSTSCNYNQQTPTRKSKKRNISIDLRKKQNLEELNTQKTEHKYHCELCNFVTYNKTDYSRHLLTNKHKRNIVLSEKNENIVIEIKQPKSYTCEYCNYNTKDLSMYTRHCNTNKHKKNIENNERNENTTENTIENTTENTTENIVVNKDIFIKILQSNQELVQDNQEFKRMLIEQNEKLIGLSQNITNNNTLNNNNQRFNLNLYLNETCKNAMNWSDFINGIQINQDDLLYNGPLGFSNAMSNVILTNLNQLESTERPIHCTDLKRKSIYIKDKDTWELQKNHDKFYKAVDRISDKFKDTYMDSQEDSDMSTEQEDALMISCRNIMMTGEHIETIPKIVNTVLKNVTIDKK